VIRVLLVDDHTLIRDGLKALLGGSGRVLVVGDVGTLAEARTQAVRLTPDVMVIDIALPDGSGIELARELAATPMPPRLVMLSMHDTDEHVARALRVGASGYVLKESAGTELIDALEAVMRGETYVCAKLAPRMPVILDHIEKTPLDVLSAREMQVLRAMVEGQSNAGIAAALGLSIKTVETYRSRLMQKLGVGDLPALVKLAIRYGVTTL
jgi:DNA-binding NarL/FixJ family response regulator